MGQNHQLRPRSLSNIELADLVRALELQLPEDAMVRGFWWAGKEQDKRNYRLCVRTRGDAHHPRSCSWTAERAGPVFRLQMRPADPHELADLLQALRELGAIEGEDVQVAEAEYDCRYRSFQLCFVALEDMVEGVPYKRWVFRRHRDGRPISVGYLCETRRGNSYDTLPGGAILRGDPWSD